MLLLLSDQPDVHLDAVEGILRSKEIAFTKYVFGAYPSQSTLAVNYLDNETTVFLKTSQGTYNIAEFSSIWYRRPGSARSLPGLDPKVKAYIEGEAQFLLDSLPLLTPNSFWLPNPILANVSKVKPYQLKLALEIGLKIPETFIGNDVEYAETLIDSHDRFIIKALNKMVFYLDLNPFQKIKAKVYNYIRDQLVKRDIDYVATSDYTARIAMFVKSFSKGEKASILNSLSSCPVIMQQAIPKKYELRITVVGNKIFPCAIYSRPGHETNQDDFRFNIDDHHYEACSIPKDIENKCFELLKKLKLNFGCIDMIVTPDDEYVFLENNTNGQWYWIQERAKLPIAEAIVDLLVAPKQNAISLS